MKVKIKTWEKMEKEFGKKNLGFSIRYIGCKYIFNESMEKEMPKDRIIEVLDGLWHGWNISEDMIECKIKKQKKNKEWKRPKIMFRGMCPTDNKYPNELSIVWNKAYFVKQYKPAGWKIAPDEMIESFKKMMNKIENKNAADKMIELRKQLNETIEELQTKTQIELLQTMEIDSLKKTIKEYVYLIQDLRITKQGLEEYIESQEKHLSIAEKAIERKDKQFYGLRAAYQDEIINKENK